MIETTKLTDNADELPQQEPEAIEAVIPESIPIPEEAAASSDVVIPEAPPTTRELIERLGRPSVFPILDM